MARACSAFRHVAGAMVVVLVRRPRAAAAQNLHYGMNTRVLTPQMADKMAELGAGVVRLAFGWDVIEPACKGCFDWTTTDAWRDEARRTRPRRSSRRSAYAPAMGQRRPSVRVPAARTIRTGTTSCSRPCRAIATTSFCGASGTSRTSTCILKGADLRTYRTLAVMAHAAIRAANPRAIVLGPEVSWHGVKDGWFAAAMNDFGDLFDIVTVALVRGRPRSRRVHGPARAAGRRMGKTGVAERERDEAVLSLFGEAGQALFYSRVLEALRGAAELVDRRQLLRSHDDRPAERLRRRHHARRLVEPAGVPLYQRVIRANP